MPVPKPGPSEDQTTFMHRCMVIKWYEATYAGAACVVSPTLYGPAVTDGDNALLAETTDEWT